MTSLPPDAYGPAVASETHENPRCWQCGRRLAEYLTEPFSLRCGRCKAQNRKGDTLILVTT